MLAVMCKCPDCRKVYDLEGKSAEAIPTTCNEVTTGGMSCILYRCWSCRSKLTKAEMKKLKILFKEACVG